MKSYIYTIIALCVCCMLAACSEQDVKYRIGVSQCSGGGWRDKQNDEMQRELLLHEGATIEIRNAQDDNKQQIADIQYFIDQKFDAIIAAPNTDDDVLADVLGKAYDSGINVILFDRRVKGDKYTAFVGCDNRGVGQHLAEFAVKCLPDGGNVIELMGNMTTIPAQQRHEGVKKTLAAHTSINLLSSADALWDGPKAELLIDSLLKIYPDVGVVVAHSDWMAQAARDYVKQNFPDRNIRFVGVDGFGADNIGVYAVEKSAIDATVIYPTGGNVIIQTVMNILEKRPFNRENFIPSYIVSKPNEALLLITMENELKHEVKTVLGLRERITFYGDQLQLEKTLLFSLLGLLVLAMGFVALFYRLYTVKRITNKKLRQQQDELVKQRDQLLVMTKEVEEATLAKLRFFTNLSHDFRTPLTLIAAPLEAMAQQENSKLLDIAQRNVRVLLRLINQILDFRKYQAGSLKLNLNPVNLDEHVHWWFDSFSTLAAKRNITMTLSVEGNNGENLMVDIRKIERMFYNIMGNALKFTPEGGAIRVEYKHRKTDILFRISDNGEGIDSESLQRIFERYYQVDSSRYEGSGIGLALVKSFVELMKGSINVTSNNDPGVGPTGTAITFIIPVESTDQKTEGNYAVSPDNLLMVEEPVVTQPQVLPNTEVETDEERPVVLVVDDNADLCVLLQSVLCKDYHVLTAADGKQGVEIAREAVPDIVLCDVMMPVMDGLECCQLLKTDVRTCHIPVMMLTACSLDEERVKGLSVGAEAYLAKPFPLSLLRAQIKTLLNNRMRVRRFYSAEEAANVQNVQQQSASAVPVHQPSLEPSAAEEKERKLSAYDEEFLEKLYRNINSNLTDEGFNVETLASQMCMSRVQLYRKSKALTDNTPVELIRNMRLEKGRDLLNAGKMTIAAAAKAVGFSDPSYFSRCYKTYFNESPSSKKMI